MEDFNSQDSQEIMKNFKSIVGSRLEKLYNEKGSDGELYAYSIAVANQKKKKAKETPQDTTMENSRLREMVIDALTEKKKPISDKTTLKEGIVDEIQDYFELMIQNQPEDALALIMDLVRNDGKNWGEWIDNIQADIVDTAGGDYEGDLRGYREELDEDLDLGHTDDEPHMLKADLYRIGKYAMELYKMLDQFEGPQEVDLPHWWQSKIIKSKELLVSAKHYLDFELKEPQIDAMVGVAAQEDAIDEGKMTKKEEKIVKGLKKSGFKKDDPEMYAIAKSKAKAKIKEAILANLKNK
jgi:hypothetical protein